MRSEIIKIGNSRGLRIPKAILEQCGLEKMVNISVKEHSLIITPYEEPRKGWEQAFQLMAQQKDDTLLDSDLPPHSWDEEEWQW